MNKPILTIPSFLADLKIEVEKAGVKPRLDGSTICFSDGYSCALDFYLRQKSNGEVRTCTFTEGMEALGMSEADAWTIMSANDHEHHAYSKGRFSPFVRAALLALIPCP